MTIEQAVEVLRGAALERAVHGPGVRVAVGPLLRGRLARTPHVVDLAAETAVSGAAHQLLSHGWTPAAVHRFAARRHEPLVIDYLCDALAAAAQWSAHSPWLGELAALRAKVWWTVGEPHLQQWIARHGVRRPDAIAVVVEVLALLEHVPRTDLPLADVPASSRPAMAGLLTDGQVVRRIDALLARAVADNYPGEANACAAKARNLMTRYSSARPERRWLA